jgi:hypothetical protein
MTCDNFLPTLPVKSIKKFAIQWKEIIFSKYFESLRPTCKPYDYNFKRNNFKYKNRLSARIDHVK